MVMNKFFISLLLVISMNGCATDLSATNKLDWLNNANPETDAKAALDKNDFRFMAISLRGTVIPGVDRTKTLQYELRCGINFIQGVSDAVRGQEQLKMMKKAHDYAAKYNAIIEHRCIPE